MPVNLRPLLLALAAGAMGLVATGCVSTQPEVGGGSKTAVTGAAGGATAENANSQLERCDQSLGTLGVVEDQNSSWYQTLRTYQLGSTIPVLRIMIQQSNCFVIVERGAAMQNMNTERALQQSGEMRNNSNFGKGQMVAADYTMSPQITFAQNTGGMGGALGGFSRSLGVLSAVGRQRQDQRSLDHADHDRQPLRRATRRRRGQREEYGLQCRRGLLRRVRRCGGGGYSNSPQGKIIIAAFTDSYNQLVRAVRNYRAQTVKGGLGTGGTLGVQGGSTPASKDVDKKTKKQ